MFQLQTSRGPATQTQCECQNVRVPERSCQRCEVSAVWPQRFVTCFSTVLSFSHDWSQICVGKIRAPRARNSNLSTPPAFPPPPQVFFTLNVVLTQNDNFLLFNVNFIHFEQSQHHNTVSNHITQHAACTRHFFTTVLLSPTNQCSTMQRDQSSPFT